MKNERRSNKDERIEELIRSLQKVRLLTTGLFKTLGTPQQRKQKFGNIIPKHLILKT